MNFESLESMIWKDHYRRRKLMACARGVLGRYLGADRAMDSWVGAYPLVKGGIKEKKGRKSRAKKLN